MKKLMWLIPIFLIILISSGLSILLLSNKEESKVFTLEDKYYIKNDIKEIEYNELNNLINNKESFAIFIYQPMCVNSANFEKVLNEFKDKYSLSFYKIAFSKVKDNLDYIKYYPSFIIFKDGKMIDFLEANKDEDTNYYLSIDGFKEWFFNYVKIIKTTNYNTTTTTTKVTTEEVHEINLDNIIKEEGKVNIYLFWGDGCPHCAQEKKFFNSIEKEYGDYYNLYMFEVWHNEDNKKILNSFANAMGDEVSGVPYTIIGDKSFSGYSESLEKEYIKAIKEYALKNEDIYFDKIKK